MSHQQWFDHMSGRWDALLTDEIISRLREIIGHVRLQPGTTVLDLGCGTGVLFPMLWEKVGREGSVMGLDLSAKMLRLARDKNLGTCCVQGDGQKLPLPDQTFDWVICNATFPHLPDGRQALLEMRRVLKPAGHLLICHAKGRETVNATHREIGGTVARDLIPPTSVMRGLLANARLDLEDIVDKPSRFVVLGRRPSSSE